MENTILTQNPQLNMLMSLPTQNSLLGKRKTPPPSTLENGSLQERDSAGDAGGPKTKQGLNPTEISNKEGNVNGDHDQGAEKRRRIEPPITVNKEDLDKINREVLGYYGPVHNREYFCVLCQTRLNSVLQLERHTVANEHLRRIHSLGMDKSKAYKFCDVCHVACASDIIYQYHMSGRKHAKSLESIENAKNLKITILGSHLEQLLHKDVVAEGNGITLGLSQAMTSFFSLQGPFIGLQYALETGTTQEQNPSYSCTLCNVVSDANNFHLHFTSSAHRINVLKKDYPDKFQTAMTVSDSTTKKGDFTAYVKDLAAEIEAKEGRKIELIKRQILRDPPQSSGDYSGHGRGSFNGRGRPTQPRGRGNKRGRGGGLGDTVNGSNWAKDNYHEQNISNQSGSGNHGKYGQFLTRGRGRGNAQRGANRGGTGFTPPYHQSSDNWNTGDSQNGYRSGRGGRRPRGKTGMYRGYRGEDWNHSGYTQNWEEDTFHKQQGWSSGNERGSRGRPGFNRGKQRNSSYSNGYNSELFGDYDTMESDYSYSQSVELSTPSHYGEMYSSPAETKYSPNQQKGRGESLYSPLYSSPTQPRHFQFPSPMGGTRWGGHVSSPVSAGPSSARMQRSPPGVDSTTLITNLAKSSIKSEEDADAAFKISTALTQALLAYRLKSVARDVETNPSALLTLLNELQGGSNRNTGASSNSSS